MCAPGRPGWPWSHRRRRCARAPCVQVGAQAHPGQCRGDEGLVAGGGIRSRVSGPQHDRGVLAGPLRTVVDPHGQGVEPEALLEGRRRPLLVAMGGDQGGVDIDGQRSLGADSGRRRRRHGPEHLRLGAQERDVGQAVAADRQRQHQLEDDLSRVMARQRLGPRRQSL